MTITIKRAEGIVEFCEDLSLRGDWESKNAELIEARARPSSRMVDPAVTALAEEVRDLEERMAPLIVVFRLRAVTRKRWQEAVASNPPRPDHEADQAVGADMGAVVDELLAEVGTIVSVTRKHDGTVEDFDPPVDWPALSGEISDAQFGEFAQKVFDLNRGVVGRPFSRPASRATAASETNSKQPNDSE